MKQILGNTPIIPIAFLVSFLKVEILSAVQTVFEMLKSLIFKEGISTFSKGFPIFLFM